MAADAVSRKVSGISWIPQETKVRRKPETKRQPPLLKWIACHKAYFALFLRAKIVSGAQPGKLFRPEWFGCDRVCQPKKPGLPPCTCVLFHVQHVFCSLRHTPKLNDTNFVYDWHETLCLSMCQLQYCRALQLCGIIKSYFNYPSIGSASSATEAKRHWLRSHRFAWVALN